MKMNINFALEEAAYINTIPGKLELSEVEGVEGNYRTTLLKVIYSDKILFNSRFR